MADRFVGSVVVPAHDESAVIARCLKELLRDDAADLLEIAVACNGCTDATAEIARTVDPRIRVLEIAEASKVAALQAADDVLTSFPRLYLDADVVLPGQAAVDVLHRLARGDILAARPPAVYDTDGCSPLVRRYFAVRVQVPGLLRRLWGAGAYALSEPGRARFDRWPPVTADDLFIDSLFTDEEIALVDTDPVLVQAPRTAASLLAILRRAMRTKTRSERSAMRPDEALPLRQPLSATVRGLAGVVSSHPGAALDVAVYAGFAVCSRLQRPGRARRWERDDSTRLA